MRWILLSLLVFSASSIATQAAASNILLNPSFETPVQTSEGNHIGNGVGTAPDNWNLDQGQFNLVRSGPNTPAAQSGDQYVDLTSLPGGNAGTFVFQAFTLAGTSSVDFGAWFSNRDGSTGSGGHAAIFDSTDTNLISAAPRVQSPDGTFVWLNSDNTVTLGAGTYTFVAFLDDPANVDSAYVIPTPIPEPSSCLLLGLGALGLLGMARRRSA